MSRTYRTLRSMAAALAAGLLGAAGAASVSEAGGGPNPEFTRLDVDRDGHLSPEETRKIPGFDRAFKEADDNHDGRLDAAEFVKAQAIHDRMRAGRYVDDNLITARVKAALLKDPQVSALGVSVATHNGIVLLSGFVDNAGQVRRAGEIAARVQGVVNVRNALGIRS